MFDVIYNTVKAFSQIRFGPWQALGDVLLVGEGNLSFARSLLRHPAAHITHMTATVFEKERNLSDETVQNANFLRKRGTLVLYGVDATKLEESLKPQKFDTIIFQFPNVNSRDAKYGRNPNYVMIRKFLRSAAAYLEPSGKVLISVVDSPYYEGVFQFDEAADFAGYETPESYPFDPSCFSGYSHTNTADDDSAIEDHRKFLTWVFKLKQ